MKDAGSPFRALTPAERAGLPGGHRRHVRALRAADRRVAEDPRGARAVVRRRPHLHRRSRRWPSGSSTGSPTSTRSSRRTKKTLGVGRGAGRHVPPAARVPRDDLLRDGGDPRQQAARSASSPACSAAAPGRASCTSGGPDRPRSAGRLLRLRPTAELVDRLVADVGHRPRAPRQQQQVELHELMPLAPRRAPSTRARVSRRSPTRSAPRCRPSLST